MSNLLRILISSDWHLDATTAGVSRLEETEAYLDRLVAEVEARDVDVFAFLGDAFDPGSMLAPLYERVLFRAAARLADAARYAAIFLAGNHDVIERAEVLTTLSGLAALQDKIPGLRVVEAPTYLEVADVGFLLLPYVSAAAQRAGVTPEDAWHCAAQRSSTVPLVVLGHMTVPGAPLGSESKEMSRGRDLDLPELGPLRPALVANGHYHAPGVVRYGGCDVVIPGSPLALTFGEAAEGRGFVVFEVPALGSGSNHA